MKAGQGAACLLGGHYLGNFRPDLSKPTLSIESIGCLLDLSRAHDHPCESKRARFCLCMIEHPLRDPQAAVVLIEVHSTKLGFAETAAFDAKRADNLIRAFDDPEGVALCVGKDFEKLLQLTTDRHRDVLL